MKKILGVIVVLAIVAVGALLMPAERKENGVQRLSRTDLEFVAIWNNLQQSEAILHIIGYPRSLNALTAINEILPD